MREQQFDDSFDGNQCRKLLENLSYSVDDFGNPGIIAMVPLLQAFNVLRKQCFNSEFVDPNFRDIAENSRTK